MTQLRSPVAESTAPYTVDSRTPGTSGPARTIRPPAGSRAGAWLRKLFWRCFLFATGGVTVHGRLPRGGCVVVANHCSHADAPALVAALPARHAPRTVAAADYWSRTWWHRTVCTVLTGAFRIRRDAAGYRDLRRRAEPLLAAGHALLMFPQGTRDGDRDRAFKRGAFALAASLRVPVVPVALCDTSVLLGKGRWLRPHPIAVRIGAPLHAPTPEQAQAAVAELEAGYRLADSGLRRRIGRLAASRWGVAIAAAWSFTEALSWPLLPELLLAVFCVAAPLAGMRLVVAAALGSVLGGLVALLLYAGTTVSLPQPLTTDRMVATARSEIRAEGALAVYHQPASGIPYKVYAAEAGSTGVDPGAWLWHSTLARGQRILIAGAMLTLVGVLGQRLRRFFPHYLVLLGCGFVTLFGFLIHSWS